jgi:hypothetical protein
LNSTIGKSYQLHNTQLLNSLQFKSFVQAAAPWTAGKQSSGSIFEFKRANYATNPEFQSSALASPLSHYPKKKNRRKEKQQINSDQRAETDRDHGVVGVAARAA